MAKFITSHRHRVRRAEEYRKRYPVRITKFDREGYVEFFLLEDVIRLYKYRLKCEEKKETVTEAGRIAKAANMQRFSAIVNIFTTAAEVARACLDAGEYKVVWQSIPERKLKVAAGSLKHLGRLKEIAISLLTKMVAESEVIDEKSRELDDDLNNMKILFDMPSPAKMPSPEEVDQVITNLQEAIPDPVAKKKNNLNLN